MNTRDKYLNDLIYFLPELGIVFWVLCAVIFGLVYERSKFLVRVSNSLVNITIIYLLIYVAYYVFTIPKNLKNISRNLLLETSFDLSVFSEFNKLLLVLITILVLASSKSYFLEKKFYYFETIILILSMLLGSMVLVSSQDLVFFYLSVEIMSLSSYVLIASKKNERDAIEASIKYFILGSVASCMVVFGSMLLYSVAGTTSIIKMKTYFLYLEGSDMHKYCLGWLFVLVGIFYKLGLFPFHYWIGDVYVGSPTPAVALIATLGKYPLVVFLIKLNFFLFQDLSLYKNIMVFSAVISIIVGSFYAFGQKSVKRLLGYSSMVHSGLILLCVTTGTIIGYKMAIIYSIVYIILTLSFFNFLMCNFKGKQKKMFLNLEDFDRLFLYKPKLSLYLSIIVFSYIGIPPLIGFFSKYFVVIVVSNNLNFYVALFISIWSLLGSVYYFRFINNMFFKLQKEKTEDPVASWTDNTLGYFVFIVLVFVLFFGIFFLEFVDFWLTVFFKMSF